ncbi:hypothetical protein ACTGUJ_09200, partial [Streptococcus suis]
MQTVFQYQKEGDREQISSYVLLSNSPRRKQLLGFLQPQIASVEVDERGIEEHFILFKKQKLTYNRFMKLTIEQTKELKTYLKDKTYSPFHRRLQ